MMVEQIGKDCIVTLDEGSITLKDCDRWKLLNSYYDRCGWGKRYTGEEMKMFGFEKKNFVFRKWSWGDIAKSGGRRG